MNTLTKICSRCEKIKQVSDFHKQKTVKCGIRSQCKTCVNGNINKKQRKVYMAKRYQEKREEILAYSRSWQIKNREKSNLRHALYNKMNLEKTTQYRATYRKKNAAKILAKNAKRHAQKINATPKWLTPDQLKEIESFYILAKEIQWLSEETLHVDHIIPLRGKDVSGLHVPWNLQILPSSENIKKGNRV